MKTVSAFPAEAAEEGAPTAAPSQKILVWDAPVRVFHWLMVLSFAGAYLTAESELWRLVHVTLGYTMAGLVAFRIVWGLVGTRPARFSSFVRGPRAVVADLRSMVTRQAAHHAGHNPAGAWAIIALLTLAAAVTISGVATFNDFGGEWLEELHEGAVNLMLGLVGLHIAGVILSSWLHRDNLIGAMLTGRKAGRPEDAAQNPRRRVAALMLLAVLGFWALQWQSAPASGLAIGGPSSIQDKDRDDD
jgi:cytochrome b